MTHGIARGYAALSDPEILHTHFKYVKGRERDIWVDTFANIARYEKERDDAKLKLSGGPHNITCVLGTSLDPKVYDVPLTIVFDAGDVNSADARRAGHKLPVRVGKDKFYVEASPSIQPITIAWK